MALTITAPASPEGWIPLENGVKYKIKSTQYTQPGFCFLIDVYVNNTKVVTLRRFPITGDTIEMDMKDIARAYIESSTSEITFAGTITPNDKCSMYIIASEYYSGQPQATATSIPCNIWNAAAPLQWEKNNSYWSSYLERYKNEFTCFYSNQNYYGRSMAYHKIPPKPLLAYAGRRLLLNPAAMSSAYRYGRGMLHHFGWFNFNYNFVYFVCIGFDIKGRGIKKAYSYISQDDLKLYTVNTHSASGWTYKSDTFDDWDDCEYLVVYLASDANTILINQDTIITESIVMHLCDVDEYYAVTYKSKDGGWGIVQCNSRETERTAVKFTTRETLKPNPIGATSRMRDVVSIVGQGSYTLHTDWVDDGINEDIKDMIVSPIQYIIHYKEGKIDYIPVVLNDTEFITREKDSKKLFNYEFTFTEAYYKENIIR